MAVIDTFLKLLVAQQAERLVLVPEEVPTVFKAEEEIQLSMPAVPADLVQRLSVEVVGSGAIMTDEPAEGTYQTEDGEAFTYQITSHGSDYRIEMFAIIEAAAVPDVPAAPEPTLPSKAPDPQTIVSARQDSHHPATLEVSAPATTTHLSDPAILAALVDAVRADASDLFFSSGKPARMRVGGEIKPLDTAPILDAQILQLIPRDDCRRELERTGSVDFGARWEVSGHPRRFRINVFRHSQGLAAALRPIRARIPTLDELHLPPDLTRLCSYPSGLVLVTGASGSGKSTTLAALVEHLNQSASRHIITIEDPIEFEHQPGQALIHQREVGADVESFSSGLRAALRENPDVILLGEMRDLPTISAALTAAETGHLVLSTLHTGNATAAVSRIVDVFPGHQQPHVRVQLASSLRAVVAQRLVPTLRNEGRRPALAKLIVNPAVANSIRDGHEHHMQSAMQTGAEDGMVTLERSLAALECQGKISRDTAFRFADDQQALHKLLD